jgi:hypothetical protein
VRRNRPEHRLSPYWLLVAAVALLILRAYLRADSLPS